MEVTCAVLGPKGTFSSEAAHRYWGGNVKLLEVDSIAEVFYMVTHGSVDAGMVPLENSLSGSIATTMDKLEENPVFIAGEILMSINHCLLAAAALSLHEVELVISQPQVLVQCEKFLKTFLPEARREIVESTARAASIIRTETRRAAAIGPYQAASIYGLKVIRSGIQDNPNNKTRFIHLSRTLSYSEGADKSSLVFSLQDRPGALYRAVGAFARRNVNMVKIESRSRRHRSDEYRFFVDIEGTPRNAQVAEALHELQEVSIGYRFLGSYRSAEKRGEGNAKRQVVAQVGK